MGSEIPEFKRKRAIKTHIEHAELHHRICMLPFSKSHASMLPERLPPLSYNPPSPLSVTSPSRLTHSPLGTQSRCPLRILPRNVQVTDADVCVRPHDPRRGRTPQRRHAINALMAISVRRLARRAGERAYCA